MCNWRFGCPLPLPHRPCRAFLSFHSHFSKPTGLIVSSTLDFVRPPASSKAYGSKIIILLRVFMLSPTQTGMSSRRSVLFSLPKRPRVGRNFLSPAIHTFVRHELFFVKKARCYDEARLFGNALSSMPLAFNMFAPLAMDLELASAVFRHLFPDFVSNVVSIRFETSPGRHEKELS